jgi:c-di-GMP-binding flagellar brake protein YcgR
MKDQRWYIRYKIEGTASLKPKDAGSSGIKADLIDISFRGFGVWADKIIKVGTDISFELITKLWDGPIIGRGEVKYAQEIKREEKSISRLGVEFKEIDKKILQSIINCLVQDECQHLKKRTT